MRLRARWVLPIASPPIDDGWVDADGGVITGLGRGPAPMDGRPEIDLGRVAVLPGLVNAHTHLELSYLAGAVAPAPRFTDWIREVMRLRREQPDPAAAHIVDAARAAITSLRGGGIVAVGDVSNTLVTVPLLKEAPVAAAVFFEVLRFRAAEAGAVIADARRRLQAVAAAPNVRVWPAPHAPYSVSPALFGGVRAWLDEQDAWRTSVHLAESPQECELLAAGTGAFRALLQELGAWDHGWVAPGCGPVEYVERLGFLAEGVLAVHGVQLTASDLARLARTRATLVTCPRSNRYVGVGDPPVARFYESGVRVAIGTDSLASAPDLGVFGELVAMRALAPEVPAERLLESATLNGARALGCERTLGSLEAGKSAALLAVSVPAGVDAVEEYLVGGLDPADVRWAAPLEAPPAVSWN